MGSEAPITAALRPLREKAKKLASFGQLRTVG